MFFDNSVDHDGSRCFLQLVIILLSARFLGEFVSKINIPSVIGELLVGILIGLAMIPWEEVGLIFAEIRSANNILNQDLYASLIIVIATATIFTPILMCLFYSQHKGISKQP